MAKTGAEEKKEAFCQEYLVDNNATQSYLRSHPGVTEKTAATEGSRLLGKPEIQSRIAELRAARAKRTRITQDRIIKELSHIAFLDFKGAFNEKVQLRDPAELPPGIRRAVKSFEWEEIGFDGGRVGTLKKMKFEGKVRALEILLDHVKEENKKAAESPVSFIELIKKAHAMKNPKGKA